MKKVILCFFISLLILLMACAPDLEPIVTERPSPIPISPTAVSLPDPSRNTLLLQYDYEPTYFRPEAFLVYGRFPPFTLYSNGILIYEDSIEAAHQPQAMMVQLTPDEIQALMQDMFNFGLAQLESYTDDCRPVGEGMTECVSDANFTILRYWQPDGLREIKIYAEFADDPTAFVEMKRFLSKYTHPKAELYLPQAATLFLREINQPTDLEIITWPLSAEWLEDLVLSDYGSQPMVLQGEELTLFLTAVPRNMGDFYCQHEGKYYHAYLIPWLPDADFTEEIGQ